MPFTVTAYIPSIKPGAYQATLTDTEEKASRKDPTNTFRVWHFQLNDGSLRTVDGSSSLATSPKSKGGKWLAAILGKTPDVGETVAPEGKSCTISVILDDNGYERVQDVMPAISGAQKAEAIHADQEREAHIPSNNEGLPF
jgi:hypothetical protein